ncbi:DUF3578 domain-containing protein [Vibrio diabolicus]|uniref:MrcB family domain-containing protein n=1 Tax=Vibrio diabolicus TaxID=50719 RepID=UPI002160FA42|nr:DUF3578 domain-containing protein [Vibrio diabolicus]MCS0383035.1 DUF3578 domain-containing protein [Vibrio diabolicus]
MLKELISKFTAVWPSEAARAKVEHAEFKKYNKIIDTQAKAGALKGSYNQYKKTYPFKDLEISKLLTKKIPESIFVYAELPKDKFRVTGSIGQGGIADIPWVCIFDLDITSTASNGYYVVYLFDAKLEALYLCLGQGWTQYETTFGVVEGRFRISNAVSEIQRQLSLPHGFSHAKIDLTSTGGLANGYRDGVIFSKKYTLNSLPDESRLINDLNIVLKSYQELKSLIGLNIMDFDIFVLEESFQNQIQTSSSKTPKGKIKRKKKARTNLKETYVRCIGPSSDAIKIAGYQCENDYMHTTFVSAASGQQYVEAHHLIPMEFQDDFEYSIDVPENIISLCPTCHRLFHHATAKDKEEILGKFFDKRSKVLSQERGVVINKETLLEYYKISPRFSD